MNDLKIKISGIIICSLLVLIIQDTTFGLSVKNHSRLTKVSMEGKQGVLVDGSLIRFSENAIEQVRKTNEAVDDIHTGSAAIFRPARHFTNDKFLVSSQRLLDLRILIIESLTEEGVRPKGRVARKALGQALHTIQDYYSHSNHVEQSDQIVTTFGHQLSSSPGNNIMPCVENPQNLDDPNNVNPETQGALSSSYFVGYGISGLEPTTPVMNNKKMYVR